MTLAYSPERYVVLAYDPWATPFQVSLLPIPARNEWSFDEVEVKHVERWRVRRHSLLPMLPCDWPAVMQERLQAEA